MSTKQTVLICGASIAGPTLAFWLDKKRFDVVVVERAKQFRPGGQNVDLRGPGIEVIEKMGLRKEVERCNTGELGIQFVDTHHHVKAEFPRISDKSFTSEIEILRGDLAKILFDQTKENVEYRFGISVAKILQTQDKARVTFDDGKDERFDLVIAADGVGSSTRHHIFGELPNYKYLGVYCAYFTLPRISRDSNWAKWYNAPGGKVVLLRPDNKGSMRVAVNFLSPDLRSQRLSVREEKNLVKSKLSGAGWESERIAAAVEQTDDFYFGPVSQIKSPTWSIGRCAMVGDAAYGPSLFTGMGTSLAVAGAYVLASELNSTEDYRAAFGSFEKTLRPYVEKTQTLPPGVPRLAYPKSKVGIWSFQKAASLCSARATQSLFRFLERFRRVPEKPFSLPNYRPE